MPRRQPRNFHQSLELFRSERRTGSRQLALESSVLGISEIAFRPAPVGLQDVSKMARHVPSHSGKPLERFVEGPRLMCIP